MNQATSFSFFKNEIKDWIVQNFKEDSTILDVGCGCGTYFDLLKDNFKNIDAVEIFEPNIITFNLLFKYRNLYKGNIVDFRYDHYDLIIFGDVIEHLIVDDAVKVLNYAVDKCNNFIIAVPYNCEQEAYINPYEKHLQSDLTIENVPIRYPILKLLYGNDLYGYYIKN